MRLGKQNINQIIYRLLKFIRRNDSVNQLNLFSLMGVKKSAKKNHFFYSSSSDKTPHTLGAFPARCHPYVYFRDAEPGTFSRDDEVTNFFYFSYICLCLTIAHTKIVRPVLRTNFKRPIL